MLRKQTPNAPLAIAAKVVKSVGECRKRKQASRGRLYAHTANSLPAPAVGFTDRRRALAHSKARTGECSGRVPQ